MTQLITSTQENQNHAGNNILEGTSGHNENHAEGRNTTIPAQKNTKTISRVFPRPLLPQFLGEEQTRNQGHLGLG